MLYLQGVYAEFEVKKKKIVMNLMNLRFTVSVSLCFDVV